MSAPEDAAAPTATHGTGVEPTPRGVLIVDLGTQYAQLIARRVREARVWCEIAPPALAIERAKEMDLAGIILSGGPASVYGDDAPEVPPELLDLGVTLMAPDTVYLAFDTVIGRDTVIEPNVVFGPGVTVESGATIRAFSHLEGCHVSRDAVVGPYARLRPGTELAEGVKIGNFVELKNAVLDEGAKVNHLSYVGDASVGSAANIGAGTITCNYDGVMKHRTQIGANAFIGSNTMLVAPVSVGDNAMTASGSVITRDVEDDALAMSRAPQETKPGRARKLMDMLRAKKARKEKTDKGAG